MDLSVVVVIGNCRDRAARMIESISAQSAAGRIELILVDAASTAAAPLDSPPGFILKCIPVRPGTMPGSARYEGARAASSSVIAFLEDHCIPQKGWASAVIEAHRGSWAAVGYTFLNGSPETWLYRACFMAEYGPWAHPQAGGPAPRLPGSNVSYKKRDLLQFGEKLAGLFEMEFLLHESLRRGGAKFYTEPNALVAHECYASFWQLLCSHWLFSRIQAARRARLFEWPVTKRLIASLAGPAALPGLQLWRARDALRGHPLYSRWLRSIPAAYLIHEFEAIGESVGLLAGSGDAARRFAPRELNAPRAPRTEVFRNSRNDGMM